MKPHNAAIKFFGTNAYDTGKGVVYGRQAAGEEFLRAWLRYSNVDEFFAFSRTKKEAHGFYKELERLDKGALGSRIVKWFSPNHFDKMDQMGAVYLPAPQLAAFAWKRRRLGASPHSTSLIGVTHTSCELDIMRSLTDMLTAPVQSWDAQICPSQSVHQMVKRLLDEQADFLREHLGAQTITYPQLPIIPLGVDNDKYTPNAAHRKSWQEKLHIKKNDVVFLYMGRLDLFTKTNLFPMFEALERASKKTSKNIVIVLSGWFINDFNEKTVKEWAPKICPSVRIEYVDGRPLENRHSIWHVADVFTSLVDNVQETFGITPIEAMSAGLPCVVSDYDGYRESVRHDVDGYRIPSCQPPAGSCYDLTCRHADSIDGYNYFVGRNSWFIAIDVEAAANAYAALADNPEKRKAMGLAARERAQTVYDWKVIIPQYQALFQELTDRRNHHKAQLQIQLPKEGFRSHPSQGDMMWAFEHYPTFTLTENSFIKKSTNASLETLHQWQEVPIYKFGSEWPLLKSASVEKIFNALSNEGTQVSAVIDAANLTVQELSQHPLRFIVWLHKIGVVEIVKP